MRREAGGNLPSQGFGFGRVHFAGKNDLLGRRKRKIESAEHEGDTERLGFHVGGECLESFAAEIAEIGPAGQPFEAEQIEGGDGVSGGLGSVVIVFKTEEEFFARRRACGFGSGGAEECSISWVGKKFRVTGSESEGEFQVALDQTGFRRDRGGR